MTSQAPQNIAARLRREFAPEVYRASALEPGSEGLAALHLSGHIVAAMLAGALNAYVVAHSAWGWALYPLTVFFIGTRFRAMGNMLHEACHGILVKGKRRNQVWGRILAVLDFTRLEPYTEEHFSHHRHLGDAERDLDFTTRQKFGFGKPEPRFVWRHYLRPLTLFHVPTFLKPVLFHREDSWAVRLGRFAYVGALVSLGLVAGWKNLALFYLVPYVTLYQVIRYWSDAVDHAGAMGNDDEFHRSRNHVFGWSVLNRIVFPRHDELHLVHHLFPAVPIAHQPRVHEILLQDPVYAARKHGISETHLEAATPLTA